MSAEDISGLHFGLFVSLGRHGAGHGTRGPKVDEKSSTSSKKLKKKVLCLLIPNF